MNTYLLTIHVNSKVGSLYVPPEKRVRSFRFDAASLNDAVDKLEEQCKKMNINRWHLVYAYSEQIKKTGI